MILSVQFGFLKVWSENWTELYLIFWNKKTEPNRIFFGSGLILPTLRLGTSSRAEFNGTDIELPRVGDAGM